MADYNHSKLSSMQGVPGHIEFHVEAVPKRSRIQKHKCYYCRHYWCYNESSAHYDRSCVEYTNCSDFISYERYVQKNAPKIEENTKRKRPKKHKPNNHKSKKARSKYVKTMDK